MNAILSLSTIFSFLTAAMPTSIWLVELVACSTILLLTTWILTLSTRNWSAAIRHRIWFMTFCGLLILPAGLLFLPSYRLPVLPAIESTADAKLRHSVSDSTFNVALKQSKLEGSANFRDEDLSRLADKETVNSGVENQSADKSIGAPGMSSSDTDLNKTAVATGLAVKPAAASSGWWVLAWGLGVIFVLIPTALAFVSCRRIVSEATEIDAGPLQALMNDLRSVLSIRRNVRLLQVSNSIVPMTWGVRKPVIAIPQGSIDWAEERKRAVLLHELAHVKRLDVAIQVGCRFVCAMYWFHPLAWLALRQLRIERELACDDCVIATGQNPGEYATQLVEIARHTITQPNSLSVAMASTSKLEHRVTSLLDLARSHVPVSQRFSGYLFIVTLLATVALSTVRLGYQPFLGLASSPAVSEIQQESKTHVVSGKIIDQDGKPIGGADVAVVANNKSRAYGFDNAGEALAESVSNDDGTFKLEFADCAKTHVSGYLIARGEGLGMSWKEINLSAKQAEINLTLLPEQIIKVQVVDFDGVPARGVTLTPSLIRKVNEDQFAETDRIQFKFDNNVQAWLPKVVSDQAGKFEIGGVASGFGVYANVEASDLFAPQSIVINSGQSEERGERDATYRSKVKNIKPGETAVIPLDSAKVFSGTVTAEDSGKPIPHATITIWASQEEMGSSAGLRTKADENGNYKLAPLPGIRFGVVAIPPKGQPYLAKKVDDIVWEDGGLKRTQNVTVP